MRTCRAVYERDPDGRWLVRVPSVRGCHSYGRTIDEAHGRIREALGLFIDDAERVTIVDEVKLPKRAAEALRTVESARRRLVRERAAVADAQRAAVQLLRKVVGLSYRDAASLLGLSHQRVQQVSRG